MQGALWTKGGNLCSSSFRQGHHSDDATASLRGARRCGLLGRPAMEIVYVYTKKRKEFGRHTGHFADRAAKVEFDIPGDEEVKLSYMEKNPCVLEMHCIASISEHAANTNVTEFHERGMYHEEGGWPRDIDPTEPEHKIRFTCVAPALPAQLDRTAARLQL